MSAPNGWLKVAFVGKYWRIAAVMNLAKLLRLKINYYSCGSGSEVLEP